MRDQGTSAQTSPGLRGGWLVLLPSASLHLADAVTDPDVVLVRIPEGPRGNNTLVFTWRELRNLHALHCHPRHEPTPVPVRHGHDLFDGFLPGSALRTITPATSSTATPAWVPLFYLRPATTDPDAAADVFVQLRATTTDACHIRLTTTPVPTAHTSDLAWLPHALALRETHMRSIGGHETCYRTAFPGQELEYKFTLRPDADIYRLATETHRRTAEGQAPGFIPKYHDEFEGWDFVNHLFEVTAPDDQRGYISFIPANNGTHIIKQKWFTDDTLIRREQLIHNAHVATSYEDHLHTHYPDLHVRALPPFRRRRYDINVEAVDTGNVFCIMYDTCTTLSSPYAALSQCEIEYRRTRTIRDPDEHAILADLETLTCWTSNVLTSHNQPAARGHYSKLRFLRELV